MANRRDLKKDINFVCSELMAECVSSMHYNKVDLDDAKSVMCSILNLQEDMICRASHVEPGLSAKTFFAKLRDDMSKRVAEIIEQIIGLG